MKKLGLLFILITALGASAEPLKIMTYNVLYGFNKKKSLDEGAAWIKSQNTDVLALQELKGFNQERLEATAKKWGHEYALIFDRDGGFPQGLTSKTPIELIEQIQPENDPKLRGTLYAKTAGIHCFVVHFDPRNYLRRQKESAAVAERVKPLVTAGESVVVMGDFNAHSSADNVLMASKTDLLEKWCTKEGGKYRCFDENGELDFSVLQMLFDAGLIDPSETPMPTFPTRLLFADTPQEEFEGRQQRIDFILVSDPLNTGTVSYPRDEVLNKISDHYPVVLELK